MRPVSPPPAWYAACFTSTRKPKHTHDSIPFTRMANEENPPQEAETPAATPSKLPKILAILVGLAIGGASGAFALGPMVAKKVAPPAGAGDTILATTHGKNEKGKDAKKPTILVLDNLVLNPAESGGSRFLLLSVAFEMKNDAVVEEMRARDAEVRDDVLRVLGARTTEQLADVKGRDGVRDELKKSINAMFTEKDAITRIYFPQYVIQ
jgi:flagellar protein FliL